MSPTSPRRALATAAPALLLGLVLSLVLTACGGDDAEAEPEQDPREASVEFCETWVASIQAMAAAGSRGPTEEQWEVTRAELADLAELEPLDGLSADAKAGLLVYTESFLALDVDDLRRLRSAESLPGVSARDEALSRAFISEAGVLCEEFVGGDGAD